MAAAATDNAAAAEEGPVPLLVRVLAGNVVTSATILACLNTADARHARRLHRAVAGAVEAVPWCDMDTPVVDVVRWRAGLPGAVGAKVARSAGRDWITSAPAAAVLGGLTHLDLRGCEFVTDAVISHLPTSLRTLNVRSCYNLTARASFAHLTVLASLDCSLTWVVYERTDGLPASLQELSISYGMRALRPGESLAHLRQLRVLRDGGNGLVDATLGSLPPSLQELHAAGCAGLTPAASFSHLTALRLLDVAASTIGDASLATLPQSLVSLKVRGCENLTRAAALPHLPALRLLDVSGTEIGDALVASLPASLIELRMVGCRGLTTGATLDHLHALRALHCFDTGLAPAALAACRDRGCAVPAAVMLRGHVPNMCFMTLLAGCRVAGCDSDGVVRLWDMAAGSMATAVPRSGLNQVCALAALRDGRRLAIGTASYDGKEGCIEVWDVDGARPACLAIIDCRRGVEALVVLANGRLAAGCADGTVRVVDVDAKGVVGTLAGHTKEERVAALAVLPDGALASGSWDKTVRVWNVCTRACVATLRGHTSEVSCLVALADGRLVSSEANGTVWLWDVGARAIVGVLTGDRGIVVAQPDGRLASTSDNGTIQLWDTRPEAAAAGASRAASAVPSEVVGVLRYGGGALLSLPDGRLACAGNAAVYLVELPPPAAYE